MDKNNFNFHNQQSGNGLPPARPVSEAMQQYYVYPRLHQNHTYTIYSPPTNGGMTRSESEESNNTNNNFQSGSQNGPIPYPIAYYAQLSPPYSPGSEVNLSSVATSPALPQSSMTLHRNMHCSNYVTSSPCFSELPAHSATNLTARASPSSSPQSDCTRNNIPQHENVVDHSLPNTNNDGGPSNEDESQDSFSDEEYPDEIERRVRVRPKTIDEITYKTEPGWFIPRKNKKGLIQLIPCKKCHKLFDTKVKMWTHLKEAHLIFEKKMLECTESYCAFVTDLKHHWEYHMKSHAGNKPVECELCPYRCINKAMLKSHMKSHSDRYEYHCANCPTKSKFHHTFKQHLEETGHRQGATFDENGNPSNKIIDVGGKRRGPKKPAEKKSKTREETVVSPPETSHHRMSPAKKKSKTRTETVVSPPETSHYRMSPAEKKSKTRVETVVSPPETPNYSFSPAETKSKTSEETVVSPTETPHYPLSPAQVAPLDLSSTVSSINPLDLSSAVSSINPMDLSSAVSSINPMDLSTFGSEIATPTESLPEVSGRSRRKGKAVKCVRKQVREEIHELKSSLTIKKEPVDIAEEPQVEIAGCYCQHCHVFFGFQDLYNEHMRYHTPGDPHRCNVCHKHYGSAVAFYKHIGIEPHYF